MSIEYFSAFTQQSQGYSKTVLDSTPPIFSQIDISSSKQTSSDLNIRSDIESTSERLITQFEQWEVYESNYSAVLKCLRLLRGNKACKRQMEAFPAALRSTYYILNLTFFQDGDLTEFLDYIDHSKLIEHACVSLRNVSSYKGAYRPILNLLLIFARVLSIEKVFFVDKKVFDRFITMIGTLHETFREVSDSLQVSVYRNIKTVLQFLQFTANPGAFVPLNTTYSADVLMKGIYFVSQKKFENSLVCFQMTALAGPTRLVSLHNICAVHVCMNNYHLAVDVAKLVLKSKCHLNFYLLFLIAIILIKYNCLSSALRIVNNCYSRLKIELKSKLHVVFFNLKRIIEYRTKKTNVDPRNYEKMAQLDKNLFLVRFDQEFNSKLATLLAFLQKESNTPLLKAITCLNIGNLFMQQRNFVVAEKFFRRGITYMPLTKLWNNLGVVLVSRGRLQQAYECFTEAKRLNPNDADTICNLANISSQLGHERDAVDHYEQALRCQQEKGWVQTNYIIHLLTTKQEVKAKQQIRQLRPNSMKNNPNYAKLKKIEVSLE
ncbi:hypothetical protein PCE1_003265 [Barthelona sp. PCE]